MIMAIYACICIYIYYIYGYMDIWKYDIYIYTRICIYTRIYGYKYADMIIDNIGHSCGL
jgi:hypothetical protein